MTEYLVKSHHSGGYYITDGDPSVIEAICDVCDDCDAIEASWDSENEEQKIDAIASVFTSESITNAEEFDARVKYAGECLENDYESISSIIDYIFEDSAEFTDTVYSLHEDGFINDKEFDKLLKRCCDDLKSQLNIVKNALGNYSLSNEHKSELKEEIGSCLSLKPAKKKKGKETE